MNDLYLTKEQAANLIAEALEGSCMTASQVANRLDLTFEQVEQALEEGVGVEACTECGWWSWIYNMTDVGAHFGTELICDDCADSKTGRG